MRLAIPVMGAAAVLLSGGVAAAQEVSRFSLDLGLAGSYVIAGTRLPTGGGAIVPHVRVSLAVSETWSVYYRQSPIVVTPSNWEAIGFLDTNDLGLSVRLSERVAIGAGGTAAPAYMRFCNRLWCLREWTLLGGAELHATVRAAGPWSLHVLARVLYAQPTAWTWPGLPEDEREPVPTIVLLGGGGTWGL